MKNSEDSSWSLIQRWIDESTTLLVKKLSRNDCSWADDPGKKQSGVYIPAEVRRSGFFPALTNLRGDKPHIFDTRFYTFWPNADQICKSSLKHYSNKGSEMHFTRVPKSEFKGLTPASLLIGGVLKNPVGGAHHWFMTIDSSTEHAETLESLLDLPVDFHFRLYEPADIHGAKPDETALLIAELEVALRKGSLDAFIASVSALPSPTSLAVAAQTEYMKTNSFDNLDPRKVQRPGDAIMQISRDIEYSLYKKAERRHRAAEVLRILLAKGAGTSAVSLVSAVVHGYPELDKTFLSASQHRKSRAGRSFEQHIAKLLSDGGIPYEEQAITGGRRPDFVLPSLSVFNRSKRDFNDALILSAKTTLRERWKQVALERFNCSLFLATVDDRVSAEAIDDMQDHEICMVVPESLKTAKETCYKDKKNVITFRDFFDHEIEAKRLGFRA